MTEQSDHQSRQRDYGFVLIVALVAANALWVLLMPVVPAIASATLHRFHLRTESFAAWAAQFPIPSMYNFANRFEVREFPPGLVDPLIDVPEKRYLNHFPARVVTFADGRFKYLLKGEDRWFTIESSYRGQSIESRFYLKRVGTTGRRFELIRLPLTGDSAEALR